MDPALSEIAEAFSHHQFAQTYVALADDVRWSNIGGDELIGKPAVVAACDASAEYLGSLHTTFTSSRTVVGTDTVVVETTADYLENDVTSTVSSCDLYDIVDAKISSITSYAVEL